MALCGRRTELGEALAQEIRAGGGQACVAGMDVTQADSVQVAFTQVEQALGPVDIVVNNAGIAMTRPALEISEDEWTGLIDVNLNGAWRVAQCAARHFHGHGRPGAIINIASILGQRVASHVAAYTCLLYTSRCV